MDGDTAGEGLFDALVDMLGDGKHWP
jgi:hypothetical protein